MRQVGNGAVEKEQKGRENRVFHCAGQAAQMVQAHFYHLMTAFTYMCIRSGIPADLPLVLILQIKPYITTLDISDLSQVLSLLTRPRSDHDLPCP